MRRMKLMVSCIHTSVCVYNCGRQQREQLYRPAHSQPVVSVSCHPTETAVFATASLDGSVLLWDTRQQKPASCVFRDSGTTTTPTALLWQPSGSGMGNILIGGIDGKVLYHSTDKRETIASCDVLRRQINKFIRCSTKASSVAVCGNEETVKVFDVSEQELKVFYSSSKHKDIVKDAFWMSESSFLTCGWDKLVFSHSLVVS